MKAGHLVLGSTVMIFIRAILFVLLAAQFVAAPVAALAPSFSEGSISLSHSAWPNTIDSNLTSPNPQSGGFFGFSVAASGNIVVVGAGFETANGQFKAGHAYTFNAETGALISTLTSPNAQLIRVFGSSVAANGSILVVGAPSEIVNGQHAGRAYIFRIT